MFNNVSPTTNDSNGLGPSALSSQLDDILTVDEALESCKPCGRFQVAIQIIFTYIIMTIGYQSVMSYFIVDNPPWKCVGNNTSHFCEQNFGIVIQSDNEKFSRRCQLNRDEWTYSSDNNYSVVTEFNLVCEKTTFAAMISGIYHIGGAFGVCISGIAADKFGRKKVLLICLIAMFTFSIACCYVTSAVQLAIIRALLGATGWSSYNNVYVYLGEFISPKYRAISTNILGMGFAISELGIAAAAYFCREWRNLQFYTSFPCLISLVFLVMLPESPRWLLVNNKKINAEAALKRIGKFNSNPILAISLKTPTISNERRNTYLDIIRNRKVLLLTLFLGFIGFTVTMAYYAISFESSNLGGNMYQSFALSAFAEIPSNFVTTYVLNRFGRKRSILICLVITGAITGSTALIPETFSSRYILRMTLLMFAKFFIVSSLLGCFVWTFEIFPTTLRLQGLGICIAFERMGSFTSPFITTVLQQYNPILPYIIIMILAFLSATGGLILPETNKGTTRECFEDFFDRPPENDSQGDYTNQNNSRNVEDGEL